jgi:sulfonate transport system permease protein
MTSLVMTKATLMARSLIIPALAIVSWELAMKSQVMSSTQAASPGVVFERVFSLITSSSFLMHALISLGRLLVAFVLGASVGTFSGILLARNRSIDALFSPSLQFLAPVPIIVWLPFMIMFFGLGNASKIILIALGVFFIVNFYAYKAARDIDKSYLELATMYQKTRLERLIHVYLPSAASDLFAVFRITLGLSWVVLFIAEYAYSTERQGGLGWFIANAKGFGQIENQLAGVAVLGAMAFSVDLCLRRFSERWLRWRVPYE